MQMSDLGSLLREHYEEIAPPIDVESLAHRLLTEDRRQATPTRLRGVLVAVAAALITLIVLGSTTLFIQSLLTDEAPVVDETPPPTTLPVDPTPDVAPAPDEGVPSAAVDVGLPFTVLDRDGDVGAGVTMIVGDDGVPLVAYVFHPNDKSQRSEIRVATCTDAACTSGGDVVMVAELHEQTAPPEANVPIGVEIAALLPDDGLPIIIWSEWDDAEEGGSSFLKAYKCADPACTDGTLSDIDSRDVSGLWVAVGPDSLPLIARRVGDWSRASIDLMKCSDPVCAGAYENTTVEIPGLGWALSVTVDDANLPVIAAQLVADDETPPTLGVARCSDPVCNEPPTVVDTSLPVQDLSEIAIGEADAPIIVGSVGQEGGSGEIILVSCTDPTCSSSPIVTTMLEPPLNGEGGDNGRFSSLAISDDGAVAVTNVTGGDVHVATCSDATCASGVADVVALQNMGWVEMDLAFASDGNPAIAIHADTDVGVFVCDDPTCAASKFVPLSAEPDQRWNATNVAPADVEFSGTNPAIEIGLDGNPVIAYLGFTDEGERVAAAKLMICDDIGCTTSVTREFDGEASWVSMIVPPNGLPVVSYAAWSEDYENQGLYVAWCADSACSTWTTERIAESGWFSSTIGIAAQSDGSVVIVYQDLDYYYVDLMTCSDGTCDGAEPIRIDSLVDPNDNDWGLRWSMNSLDVAVLPDGRPVIAAAQNNGDFRFVECLNVACSDSEMVSVDLTLDSITAAIEVGQNGLPFLAYYDDGELTAVACHDTGCGDRVMTSIGEATGGGCGSVRPSIAFLPDGNPMITYWAPRALMLAECTSSACTDATVDIFANVRTYELAVLPNGSPVMAYFTNSVQEAPLAEDECCPPAYLSVATCMSCLCVGD
jgi:hypothetical protein